MYGNVSINDQTMVRAENLGGRTFPVSRILRYGSDFDEDFVVSNRRHGLLLDLDGLVGLHHLRLHRLWDCLRHPFLENWTTEYLVMLIFSSKLSHTVDIYTTCASITS